MFVTKLFQAVFPAILLFGCVVGDGDFSDPDPEPGCRAYLDEPERCGQSWEGRIVETCADGAVTTSLRFDRPDVPDTLRANVMALDEERIVDMHWGAPFGVVATVCDGPLCREFFVEFRSHSVLPVSEGTGLLMLWESDSVHDAMTNAADLGAIRLDAAQLCSP